MHDEISVESANQCVDGLVAEIHRLQEPKIPTKEQIDIVYNCSALCGDVPKGVISIIINEWEKIRSQQ